MELTINDKFKIIRNDSLSEASYISLFSLYQPIIGYKAVNLYMTLYAESKMFTFETHQRLSLITNMSIKEINEERIRLEEMLLLKTYRRDNEYIYKLIAPLNANMFLENMIFAKLLLKWLGDEQYHITLSKFLANENLDGFTDVSSKLNHNYEQVLNNVEFKKIQSFSNEELAVKYNFDFEELFRETSPLVFPIKTRTYENLEVIGKMASLCGLSANQMNVIIGKCSDYEKETIDMELLKYLCLNSKPEIKEVSDKYDCSPLLFLQNKQHGTSVTKVDARLLEYLSINLKMSNSVINVLIEYVLNISENRLPRNLVEKIAGEWIRENINTKEKAIEKSKADNFSSKKTMILPEYYGEIEENKELDISDNNIESLKARIKGIS